MSRRGRLGLFATGAVVLAAVLAAGLTGLPAFGARVGSDGLAVLHTGVALRHATDLVTLLNFDLRAFDTLGEEFILFTAILGVALILREIRGEGEEPREDAGDEHHFRDPGAALRAFSLVLVPMIVVLGVYIVVHGQLTPGGGFQGGVVLAAGPLAVFLGARYLRMRQIAPQRLVELSDAFGAAGLVAIGLGGLIFTGIFLRNFLPLGSTGHLLSAGEIVPASIAVGAEVSGAFLVGFSEFFDQAILVREGDR